jgi:dephospho-CoA kinase
LSEVIHANGRMQNIDGYLYRVTTDANGTHYDLMGINHPNYWVDALLDKVSVLSMEGHNIVVDDIRRLNEATALRDNDFLLVKIECDEKIRLARLKERDGNFNPDTLENISESEVDKLPCDGVITNESPLNDVMLQLKYLITTYLLKFDNNTIK